MQLRHQYIREPLVIWRRAAALSLALAALLPATAGAAPREAGVWINDIGDGAVKIEPCGNKLCGRIVWLKNPLNDQGVPKHDRYNPDESQRNRPICGLPVLGALEEMPEGGFDNGWVYDPKEGKSYSVAIAARGPGELSVTGYKGVKFLGKTFTWTRAKAELPSCNAQPAAAKPSGDTAATGAGAGSAGAAAPIKAKKAPKAEAAVIQDAEVSPADRQAKPQPPAADVIVVEPPATSKPVKVKPKPEATDAVKAAPETGAPPAAKTPSANAAVSPPAGTSAPKKKPKAETAAAKTDATGAVSDPAAPAPAKKKVVAKDGTKTAKKTEASKEVLPWATRQ